jgi:hypothetical protein
MVLSNSQTAKQKIKRWKWVWFFLSLPIIFGLIYLGQRPERIRVEAAEAALEQAGYFGANASRYQSPKNMQRCGVGQIRNKGRAYAWETATQRGIFCYPMDGRPQRIIVDR